MSAKPDTTVAQFEAKHTRDAADDFDEAEGACLALTCVVTSS